jgi:FkbM family methyltransferase
MSFVVDIGANEGQWATMFRKLVRPREMWMFEPNPEAMKICRQRIGDGSGVSFYEMALGASRGVATLNVTSSSDFASLLKPKSEFLELHYKQNAARIIGEHTVEVQPPR